MGRIAQPARDIFLVLPALTLIHHLADAIPISEWLRAIVVHWREITHRAIEATIDAIPYIPQVDVPDIVLDEISLAILLAASTATPFLTKRWFGQQVETTVFTNQVSSQTFWLCAIILWTVLFATYETKLYTRELGMQFDTGSAAEKAGYWAIVAFIYFLPALFLLAGLYRGAFGKVFLFLCLLMMIYQHFNLVHRSGLSTVSDADVAFISMLSASTIPIHAFIVITLHKYNRNSLPLVIAIATAILIADFLIQFTEFAFRLAWSRWHDTAGYFGDLPNEPG